MMTMAKTLLHRWLFTVAILLHAATTTTTNTGGAFAAASSSVQRITLPETSSALCLDGNPAGFFLEKAAGESKDRDKFVVFLQGGGLCRSQADCVARSRTALGSFRRNTSPNRVQLLDDEGSPFYAFNKVRIPYCSGDVWRGTAKRSSNWANLPIMGHSIVMAVIDELLPSLANASELVLLGESAGAIGVCNVADVIKQRLTPLGVEVRAVVDSGWFPSWKLDLTETPLTTDDAMRERTMAQQFFGGDVHKACLAAELPRKNDDGGEAMDWPTVVTDDTSVDVVRAVIACSTCDKILMNSNVTSWMIRNNRWDSYPEAAGALVCGIASLPACLNLAGPSQGLREWGKRLEQDLANGIARFGSGLGFYIPSCYSHFATNAQYIGQTSPIQATSLWWQASSSNTSAEKAREYQLMDGYGDNLQCNPSCGGDCRRCSLLQQTACLNGCAEPSQPCALIRFNSSDDDIVINKVAAADEPCAPFGM
ncbi:hypothetical protein PPROV_001009800 [Pycnococcus provasolii]|uniref:Pectin acetylesterase n=1 Tax=Pycnococcus provasolii TaxID=41880 RepID=A0A830HZX3_9CHLO|nr:hypothetical protein PPROV_001009800 [Pycnococcus provasolii]